MLSVAQGEQRGKRHRHLLVYSMSIYLAPTRYQTQQRMRALPHEAYNLVGVTVKPVTHKQVRQRRGWRHKEDVMEGAGAAP